mmetsp:Transcript_628/g.1672  ORF Transcript_628/g.1672 Transcript_628/m.1672 type:complete len:93 (+) Transcript_628:677-955(+)
MSGRVNCQLREMARVSSLQKKAPVAGKLCGDEGVTNLPLLHENDERTAAHVSIAGCSLVDDALSRINRRDAHLCGCSNSSVLRLRDRLDRCF